MLSLGEVARYLSRHKLDVLCVVVVVVIAAEVHLRLPWGRQMEYQPDPELVGVLRPGQASLKEHINSDGHRGKETDWTKPAIVAVGDSQGWGTGLPDDVIWTARLENLLHRRLGLNDVQVVNASHPGHGPHHQYVRLRRVLEAHKVEAALVRVSIEDRNFTAPSPAELPALAAAVASRQTVRTVTKFAPFLLHRIAGEGPLFNFFGKGGNPQAPTARSAQSGELMWSRQRDWWERMIELCADRSTPI